MNFTEAKFYKTLEDGKILCTLCPRACEIREGKKGVCFARKNINNKLYATTYGRLTSINIDPIEKKPLNHFLPGSISLSVGSAGCNLLCKFCQNWSISKNDIDEIRSDWIPPENLVNLAIQHECQSISYTYNEPTIFAEYVMETAKIAREKNIKNVMVTNGYVTKEALPRLYEFIDAANVDLKAFDENFYKELCDAKLKSVLDTLCSLLKLGVWVEITTLLIPSLNDSDEQIKEECKWIVENLGKDVPVHFSAFHPDYKLLNIERTKASTLRRAKEIARSFGINYIYEGNVMGEGNNTYCPSCNRLLINRIWFDVTENNISSNDRCPCGQKIPIVIS